MSKLSCFLKGSSKVFDFSVLYSPNSTNNIKESWISVGESITKAINETSSSGKSKPKKSKHSPR